MIKKMIAPIVIAVIFAAYTILYSVLILSEPLVPGWVKATGAVVALALIGVMVYVTMERIKEIRSGEEDDISKY